MSVIFLRTFSACKKKKNPLSFYRLSETNRIRTPWSQFYWKSPTAAASSCPYSNPVSGDSCRRIFFFKLKFAVSVRRVFDDRKKNSSVQCPVTRVRRWNNDLFCSHCSAEEIGNINVVDAGLWRASYTICIEIARADCRRCLHWSTAGFDRVLQLNTLELHLPTRYVSALITDNI